MRDGSQNCHFGDLNNKNKKKIISLFFYLHPFHPIILIRFLVQIDSYKKSLICI